MKNQEILLHKGSTKKYFKEKVDSYLSAKLWLKSISIIYPEYLEITNRTT